MDLDEREKMYLDIQRSQGAKAEKQTFSCLKKRELVERLTLVKNQVKEMQLLAAVFCWECVLVSCAQNEKVLLVKFV